MLKEKIMSDIKEAMKAGEAVRLGVLRMLVSSLNNAKIEKRAKTGADAELTDDALRKLLKK